MALGPRKTTAASTGYTNIPSTGYGTFNNWQPPADWPSLGGCPMGNIELLVCDQELATYAFTVTTTSGNYTVNWGDGSANSYASGATAQHTYTVGAGKPCSLGYTTFVITISPTSGALKTFIVAPHSLATNTQQHGILNAVFRTPSLISLAFYATLVRCYQLQNCTVSNAALTTATNMFAYCYSLQSLTLPALPALTTATSMFDILLFPPVTHTPRTPSTHHGDEHVLRLLFPPVTHTPRTPSTHHGDEHVRILLFPPVTHPPRTPSTHHGDEHVLLLLFPPVTHTPRTPSTHHGDEHVPKLLFSQHHRQSRELWGCFCGAVRSGV